jgi:sarcosine oxidase subunit delta
MAAPLEAWVQAVYVRGNPRGPHRERWHHSDGCRLWLIVERNTLTHEISSVTPANGRIAELLKERPR